MGEKDKARASFEEALALYKSLRLEFRAGEVTESLKSLACGEEFDV
jgi:hypothetical protein